jgi:hypothetical protein
LFSRLVYDRKIEAREELGLTGLAAVQYLRRYKILQIAVVRKDEDQVLRAFKLWTLFFEVSDNRKQFLIIDLVITLDR